ncbi:MAG: hypothetical protein L7S55_00480 [Luminiphilus sp.]|nr:hypothetical protein [Luminiphilus sp.]
MKTVFFALLVSLTSAIAAAAHANSNFADPNADIRSLIEGLVGGDNTDVSSLLDDLVDALGQGGLASEDLTELLDNLASLDFEGLVDELAALREELGLYRYNFVGVAQQAAFDGGASPTFWELSALCEETFGEGARLTRTAEIAYMLERGDLQLEGLDRAIFKSSYPIAYRDGLYDALVNAPADMNGLVVYDGNQDRFVLDDAGTASAACSARGQ